MNYEVSVVDHFSAAHQIKEVNSKCERLHGHNWKVEAWVRADNLDENGLVIDFRLLKKALKKILDTLDHNYINDLPFFKEKNATSENIALFIYQELSLIIDDQRIKVSKVRVAESHNSFAEYISD
jgi:6-pyruvoyltetrahydropterin/6-carboxytetrahydropterin synthase